MKKALFLLALVGISETVYSMELPQMAALSIPVQSDLVSDLVLEPFDKAKHEKDLSEINLANIKDFYPLLKKEPVDTNLEMYQLQLENFIKKGTTWVLLNKTSKCIGYISYTMTRPQEDAIFQETDKEKLVKILIGELAAPEYAEYKKCGHISLTAVDKKFRRQGHSQTLLRHAISDLITRGAQSITVDTSSENTAAQAAYKKFGFNDYKKFGFNETNSQKETNSPLQSVRLKYTPATA